MLFKPILRMNIF